MDNDVVVVPLAEEDLEVVRPALEAVREKDFTEEAVALSDLSSEPDDPAWAGRFVARARGIAIGYISGEKDSMYGAHVARVCENPGDLAVASLLYVWDQQQSDVATALMTKLADHLIKEGCAYLTLSINGNLNRKTPAVPDAFDREARTRFVTRRCDLVILSQGENPVVAGGPLRRLHHRLSSRSYATTRRSPGSLSGL